MRKDQKLAQRLRKEGFDVRPVRGSAANQGYYVIERNVDRSTETIGVIENNKVSVIYGSYSIDHEHVALRILGQIEGAVRLRKILEELNISYVEETPIYERASLSRLGIGIPETACTATRERREISRNEVVQHITEAGRAYLDDLVNSIK